MNCEILRGVSQENVQVVTASWAAFARGDYEASLGTYAENTVWDEPNSGRMARSTWDTAR